MSTATGAHVGASVRALAPAKINPVLRVGTHRPDGYHEIDTLIVTLDWCDRVEATITRGGRVEIELDGPHASADVPRDERNLAVRAARSVIEYARERIGLDAAAGVALRLTKNVPSGAGLGGGSSDAAATMFAVERALGVELDGVERAARLSSLGSDCAFFACYGGFARCRGRGERVRPLALTPAGWWVAVATPREFASTAAVYGALAGSLASARQASVDESLLARPLDDARRALFNDLEAPALAAVPGLRCWRALLDRVGAAHYRLAGSGSSFFGFYRERSAAEFDLATIAREAAREGLDLRASTVASLAGRGARVER